MNKFELISVEKARRLAMEPGYIVVDLRSRVEYDKNHIENAVNIPEGNMRAIEGFNRRNDVWVLYCRRGSLSFRLAREMAEKGYKVMAVVGGFQ